MYFLVKNIPINLPNVKNDQNNDEPTPDSSAVLKKFLSFTTNLLNFRYFDFLLGFSILKGDNKSIK